MIDALLLDLGNVVMEIDFRRTFRHWAAHASVDAGELHARWSEDEAYRAHERGELAFDEYVAALGDRLGITLSPDVWEAGWNDIFVGPYEQVQTALADVAQRLPLFAFTNTNPTHERAWRHRYGNALIHFDEIFVSSTIGQRKPEPAAFLWVADAMGVHPERILFLDDNAENVAGARSAGLQTVWVRSEADVVDALGRF
ncbi:MAG: HAD family hydrolase [Pseudomonadales bacterium]